MKKSRVSQMITSTKQNLPNSIEGEKSQPSKPNTHTCTGISLDDLQSTIREIIRAEINAMQQKSSSEDRPRMVLQDWVCSHCRRMGKGRECTHCFKCASNEQFQRGCK